MDQGLYLENIQRLAREHGLPVSRTKDELIDELLASGELEVGEVVAFLTVDDLRYFLGELGLPSGASRGVLAERLTEALTPRSPPKTRKPSRRSRMAPEPKPPTTASIEPASEYEPRASAQPRSPDLSPEIHLSVSVPPGPPPAVHVTLPKPERPSAAWGFAGIVLAIPAAAALYFGIQVWGPVVGSAFGIGVGIAIGISLLVTARRWVPFIDGIGRIDS